MKLQLKQLLLLLALSFILIGLTSCDADPSYKKVRISKENQIAKGVVLSKAEQRKFGVILLGPTEDMDDLALYSVDEDSDLNRMDEVYFTLFDVNGVLFAEDFKDEPGDFKLQVMSFDSKLNWHSFLEHDHHSKSEIHKRWHLTKVTKNRDGETIWTGKPFLDSGKLGKEETKIGADGNYEKYKDSTKVIVWITEITRGKVTEVDDCHRHNGYPVDCPPD